MPRERIELNSNYAKAEGHNNIMLSWSDYPKGNLEISVEARLKTINHIVLTKKEAQELLAVVGTYIKGGC